MPAANARIFDNYFFLFDCKTGYSRSGHGVPKVWVERLDWIAKSVVMSDIEVPGQNNVSGTLRSILGIMFPEMHHTRTFLTFSKSQT